jgi:sporulation protein YlmC with PRC-barrel domain
MTEDLVMKMLRMAPLVAFCVLGSVGCSHVRQERDGVAAAAERGAVDSGVAAVTARMDARWVSAVIGMKIETPAGARLGRVEDVMVDGYGRPGFAIVSYGGVMGIGTKYTAVPWATVAEMLDRDRLLVDRSNLESAPMLSNARPEPGNKGWRRAAESYWNGKRVAAQ